MRFACLSVDVYDPNLLLASGTWTIKVTTESVRLVDAVETDGHETRIIARHPNVRVVPYDTRSTRFFDQLGISQVGDVRIKKIERSPETRPILILALNSVGLKQLVAAQDLIIINGLARLELSELGSGCDPFIVVLHVVFEPAP